MANLNAATHVMRKESVECFGVDQSDAIGVMVVEFDSEMDRVPVCARNSDNLLSSALSLWSLVSNDSCVSAVLSDECASKVDVNVKCTGSEE